jgi:geranylgeranyl diphosphate synthase type 3
MDLFKKFPDLLKHKMPVLTEIGALYSLGIQLMQLFSKNKTDFTKLTGIMGLYYQISNDYRNLCWQEVTSELLVLNI